MAALRCLLLCCALGAVLGRILDDDTAPLQHGAAHHARAWERAGVTPGRLCPVGSVLGEYVRRHRLQAQPPSDFGHGCGGPCTLQSGNAWMQRNWEPQLRCVGDQRLGNVGDGGKWVCDPDCLLEKGKCLIYSFGSNNDFSFETSMKGWACETHVFDHTVMNPTPPAGVTFHRFGIQPSGSSATLKSLPTFLEELGHNERVVDIMKIDVEGAEFATFADAGTMAALKKHVRQLLLEVHWGAGGGEAGMTALGKVLADNGFLTFSKEPNIQYSSGDCVEFSLLNTHLV